MDESTDSALLVLHWPPGQIRVSPGWQVSRPSATVVAVNDLVARDRITVGWAATIYYYVVMFLCVCVFMGGVVSGVHGLLRAASPDMAANATCLPPPAPRVTDLAHVSPAEQRCRAAERETQIRQGSFQVLQGLAMVTVSGLVFMWHYRRARQLELPLRRSVHRSGS